MDRRDILLVVLLPLVVVVVLVAVELKLSTDQGRLLPALRYDTTQMIVTLNLELVKLFMGLATAVIGGIAYYIKSAGLFTSETRGSLTMLVLTTVAAVLSIFFGHLLIANMRADLALQRFDVRSPHLVWPERLQYLSFLFALSWFVAVVIKVERQKAHAAEVEEEEEIALSVGGLY